MNSDLGDNQTGEELVPPTRKALGEASELSEEILRNLELNQLPLADVALKTSRLARLLNDWNIQTMMQYEVSGYPTKADGIPPEIWKLGGLAGRHYEDKETITKKVVQLMYTDSIAALESQVQTSEASLNAAKDPDVSLTSANRMQLVQAPLGNVMERNNIRWGLNLASARLASRKNFIYQYATEKYYQLKFSGVASTVFERIRSRVDLDIGGVVPTALRQFSAVHEYLESENPENWSNAVHSCRRILQGLADAVFPATEEDRTIEVDGKIRKIKLGNDQYINRLITFIENSSASSRFQEIVGSHLRFIGDRLDSIFRAAQKGSHATVTKEEADRYVVYTYMIVGDIISLIPPK